MSIYAVVSSSRLGTFGETPTIHSTSTFENNVPLLVCNVFEKLESRIKLVQFGKFGFGQRFDQRALRMLGTLHRRQVCHCIARISQDRHNRLLRTDSKPSHDGFNRTTFGSSAIEMK